MSERLRFVVAAATTAAILAFVNLQIAGKERLVNDGSVMLLRLAPIDPRSLLQGDYMALRYSMATEVAAAADAAGVEDGAAIVSLDAADEAHFVALDTGQALPPAQQRLKFRKRGETVRLASDAWFFEEGNGDRYDGARFGELRVARDGTAVLVGLRDGEARPLP